MRIQNPLPLMRVATFACAVWVVAATPANAQVITIQTDFTWRSIAPPLNQTGTPIGSAGLVWETANPGWNNSLSYNDSNANGWSNSGPGNSSGLPNPIWSLAASSPAYFRFSFPVSGVPTQVTMQVFVDDDALVYLNGNLVFNDQNGGATISNPFDVTPLVLSGTNLIAVKAHDSFGGGGYGLALSLTIQTIPEPTSLVLMSCVAAGFLRRCIRRRCN